MRLTLQLWPAIFMPINCLQTIAILVTEIPLACKLH